MPAADLIRLVKTLGAPYGLERSVKISHGVLDDDRCLISIGRLALGEQPAERLLQIGLELLMPPNFAAALPGSLQQADIIHFGYEAGAGQEVYKIYFEYASRVRHAMAAMSQGPELVHLAYKWSPSRAGGATVTKYTWIPCRTRVELDAKLRSLLPAGEAPRALRCALGFVEKTAALADSGELLLLEVQEPGNLRRSCDLNVYDAALRLREVADLLDAALLDFAVPKPRARSVFDRAQDKALGHLSAGVGRNGEEFVTIYFGVEGH
jgi:tryptophan 7-halogenase